MIENVFQELEVESYSSFSLHGNCVRLQLRIISVFQKSKGLSSNGPDHQDEERNTYKLPCTSGEFFFFKLKIKMLIG